MSLYRSSYLAVEAAMRTADRRLEMEGSWGPDFPELLEYMAYATAPLSASFEVLRHARRDSGGRTMVVVTEYCSSDLESSPGTLDDAFRSALGGASDILEGSNETFVLCASGASTRSVRVVQAVSLVAAEIGAHFPPIAGVGFEGCAMNLGEQARMIGGLAYARRVKRLVFMSPVASIARVAATHACALQQIVDAENVRLHELTTRGVISPESWDRRQMPEVLFVAVGEWSGETHVGLRPPGSTVSNGRVAFGPTMGEYCGECHLRYRAEQDVVTSIDYACGALSPKDMLKLVPGWVKDFMATSA